MTTRSKVCILGSRGYPSTYGGFETLVRRLAPYLSKNGFDVTVYGRAGLRQPKTRQHQAVNVVETPGIESNSFSTLTHGLTATIDAAVRKFDAALVLNVANGFWLPLLRSRGVPTLVNVDGIEWERDKWSSSGKAVFRTGAHWTKRYATALVSDSVAIQGYWKRTFGRDSTFIPYGADILPGLPIDRIERLGLKPRKYILVVARLVPENNVQLSAEAIGSMKNDLPLVVVGSGSRDIEEELRRTSPRVQLLGHVADQELLSQLWQHCAVYIHGHSVGGTNPALLQALGAGSPTLALDTPYNREVLGWDSMLYPKEARRLGQRVDFLLASAVDRAALTAHGRELISSRYSWPLVYQKYEAALRAVMEK